MPIGTNEQRSSASLLQAACRRNQDLSDVCPVLFRVRFANLAKIDTLDQKRRVASAISAPEHLFVDPGII
jgi:hypothetical protein